MAKPRTLVAIPVYNEAKTVRAVVSEVRRYTDDLLLIDDGSTDQTPDEIDAIRDRVDLIRHEGNLGYGRSLRDAFRRAEDRGFDWVITMDCDEQHEPVEIPAFLRLIAQDRADIISGSRYLDSALEPAGAAPAPRRRINRQITAELNQRLGLGLTDGFCGFKAHRVRTLAGLSLSEAGYAFPMQFWVQLAAAGASIIEHPVRRIYNDPNRTFGGGLDDHDERLRHYRDVLHREIRRHADRLPASASAGLIVPCGCPEA